MNQRLEDLDFADDIELLSLTQEHMQRKTEDLELSVGRLVLKPNVGKGNLLIVNNRINAPIKIQRTGRPLYISRINNG